ncbi:MAG: phase variable surface lipoprotein [Candidatus Phytoplasma australasiaticum]|nr:phase variable surface lipoprotein [Candidatus Phytoplasma australasiaticum]MDV3140836.1 phase variable surface lipoprotein [Sweet potato little leaf phytoplasma]
MNHHSEIRIGGWINKSNTPTDLAQIKHFLQTLKAEIINLTIVVHSKKKNTYQEANYRPQNQTLFVDTKILAEIKAYKITLIEEHFATINSKQPLLTDLTPLKIKNNSLKNHYPLFQINYQNETKNRIKELIGKMAIHNLKTLQLYPLDPNKRDKYNNPINTNYQKSLNIIYYQQKDLKYITSFITKAKQGYRVKKLHPMYKYISKNK